MQIKRTTDGFMNEFFHSCKVLVWSGNYNILNRLFNFSSVSPSVFPALQCFGLMAQRDCIAMTMTVAVQK